MKICRFDNDRLGVVEGDRVLDVTGALDVLPKLSWPLPQGDPLVANIDKVVARIQEIKHAATPKALTSVKLKSPVANPSKIIGAPVNYQLHIDEATKNPTAFANPSSNMLNIRTAGPFLKANSSLVGPSEGVSLRFPDRRNDHEVELAVVIGKAGSAIPAAKALDHVAGYAIGLDMTVRGTEDRSVRKSIDSYSVLGPWLVTADEIADPNNLDLWITVNNEPRQKSNTRMLILNVQQCIEFFSTYYTLLPGDIIMSGTPEGVGPVKNGDLMIAEVEKVGRMEVRVRNAREALRLDRLKRAFCAAVVLGDPAHYRRFGFVSARRFGLSSEYDAPEDAFMALGLRPGALAQAQDLCRYADEFRE